MIDETTEKDSSADLGGRVDAIVMCKWWMPHKYGAWQDLYEKETTRNEPVLIQERRCSVCNAASRQTVQI